MQKIRENFKSGILFIKRFFEPAMANKVDSSKAIFEAAFGSFWFDILPIFIIPVFIKYIENQDVKNIFIMSILVTVFYIIVWATHVFIRKWDLSYVHLISYQIDKKYRNKIILKDNTFFENIGTGKVQSIVQKGISAWTFALWEVLYFAPKAIFAVGSGFFVMYKFGFLYILFFTTLLLVVSLVYVYYNKKRLQYRNKINDIDDLHNASSVRNIMSRVEIVLAGKVYEESDKIKNFNLQKYKLDTASAKYEFLADLAISALTCLLPFLGILGILYLGGFEKFTTLELITFVYFSTRLSNIAWGMLWVVKQIMEKYPEMNSFWEFIDKTPEIKNYETGKTFEHKNGKIVLQNVSFSYGKEIENKN